MGLDFENKRVRMLYGTIIGVVLTIAGIVTGTDAVTGIGLFVVIMSVVFV